MGLTLEETIMRLIGTRCVTALAALLAVGCGGNDARSGDAAVLGAGGAGGSAGGAGSGGDGAGGGGQLSDAGTPADGTGPGGAAGSAGALDFSQVEAVLV